MRGPRDARRHGKRIGLASRNDVLLVPQPSRVILTALDDGAAASAGSPSITPLHLHEATHGRDGDRREIAAKLAHYVRTRQHGDA
jgi:hypothetical protein